MNCTFLATAAFGLEGVVANELKRLGLEARGENGGARFEGRPIDVSQGVFNCIWQGDVCEFAIRSLLHTAVPPEKLNVSSPEALSIRGAAKELGKRLGREPVFTGEEVQSALFSNCQKMVQWMGTPSLGALELIDLVAQWVKDGGEAISAPTHFEATNGVY